MAARNDEQLPSPGGSGDSGKRSWDIPFEDMFVQEDGTAPSSPAGKVHSRLIRAMALLQEGTEMTETGKAGVTTGHKAAFVYAKWAMRCAERHEKPKLVAVCHLVLGHIYWDLRVWKGAHHHYVRAASVRQFAANKGPDGLEARTRRCLEELRLLATPDPKLGDDQLLDDFVDALVEAYVPLSSRGSDHDHADDMDEDEVGNADGPLLIRDVHGTLVDILPQRPALRTVRGKKFGVAGSSTKSK